MIKTLRKDKFVFTPIAFPFLSYYTLNVQWNILAKTLTLLVMETNRLEVIEWLQHVKKQQAEIKKGPFVDLAKDALSLKILDDAEEVGELRFKNIDIADHKCEWACMTEGCSRELMHHIVLSYQEMEIRKQSHEAA